MSTPVGVGNKYITLEDAINNGIRDIVITSNMHVKNGLLLSYGKYHIRISNSSLLYFDIEDCALIGKEFTMVLLEGGSIELTSKILCMDNITVNMKNVSLSCNNSCLHNVRLVDSIISGNVNLYNCNVNNVTMEGDITCITGRNIIKDSRIREDTLIINGGKLIMDNSYINNINTIDGEIIVSNSDICNWICSSKSTKMNITLQHNEIGSCSLPSLDNALISYNTFKSDIGLLYVYNSNISYNRGTSIVIEFLRDSIIEHNNMSALTISHESSSSIIYNNICDMDIDVMSSKYDKISHNLCSNLTLTTMDKSRIKSNNAKNIIVKYLLQSTLSLHTDTNITITMCIDSRIDCNTCCDINIGTMTRSYYVGNYIDLTDIVTINNPTMSTISGNKSYQLDMGHIHIVLGSDNLVQDNCNISII